MSNANDPTVIVTAASRVNTLIDVTGPQADAGWKAMWPSVSQR